MSVRMWVVLPFTMYSSHELIHWSQLGGWLKSDLHQVNIPSNLKISQVNSEETKINHFLCILTSKDMTTTRRRSFGLDGLQHVRALVVSLAGRHRATPLLVVLSASASNRTIPLLGVASSAKTVPIHYVRRGQHRTYMGLGFGRCPLVLSRIFSRILPILSYDKWWMLPLLISILE